MNRVLSAIVTYQFSHYLKCSVRSYFDFFGHSKLLILDTGDSPQVKSAVEELDREFPGSIEYHKIAPPKDSVLRVGALYDAYNFALNYARLQRFPILQLIQDDMQFVWEQKNLLDEVESLFERYPDICNVQNIFLKKFASNLEKRLSLEANAGAEFYKSVDCGICDIGFFDVKKLEGFSFGPTEGEHSRRMLDKGFRLATLTTPNLAFVPWPATKRLGKVFGSEIPAAQRLYYKPLAPEQFNQLLTRNKKIFPITEDYCLPWGLNCLWPYWYTTPSKEYYQLTVFARRRLGLKVFWPRPVHREAALPFLGPRSNLSLLLALAVQSLWFRFTKFKSRIKP